jgi:hypothetical protein
MNTKKLITMALTVALVSITANASVIIQPTVDLFETTDLGGGLFGYEFHLVGNDIVNGNPTTDTLGTFKARDILFEGVGGAQIQQVLAGGFSPIDTQSAGAVWPPTMYVPASDTWVYDGWNLGATNSVGLATGDPVNLSLERTDVSVQLSSVPLVYIVADGDVQWGQNGNGTISRGVKSGGTDYVATVPTAGSTASAGFPGDTQGNPIMPTSQRPVDDPRLPEPTTEFTFTDVPGEGRWFDPPMVPAYKYVTDGNSNFTSVILPVGIDGDGQFLIEVFGQGTAPATEGVAFDFSAHFAGDISKFWVLNIDPLADAGDPGAFPTFLEFDAATVTFTQTGVPEPATMSVLFFGAMGLVARKRRRS